jgi:hypothetical protein
MARYGPVLKPGYFIGVLPTMAARASLEHMTKHGRVPSWEVLEQLVLDSQASVSGGPLDDDQKARVHDFTLRLRELDVGDHEFVASRVVKFARERATLLAIRQSIADIQEGKMPESGFVSRFEEALRVGQDMDNLGYVLHRDAEDVVRKITASTYGIRTGYHLLDKIWKNGLAPGWLVILLAPPKRYKTATCINLALNMIGPSIGENVFYYTCEISQELALVRALFNLAGLGQDAMYANPERFILSAKEQINRLVAGNLVVKGYAAKSVTIADIGAHANTVIHQLGIQPRAVFIDYAETIRAADSSASEHQQSASVYTDARALGHRLNCPVIMPDRCTRETVDLPVPSMKSFQGAFQKGGIVDIAIGLCATDAEYLNNILRAFVFMNRHGPAYQHLRGKVDPDLMQIEFEEEIEYVPDEAESPRGRRQRDSSGPARNLPEELQQ